jgi:hypothetical protein
MRTVHVNWSVDSGLSSEQKQRVESILSHLVTDYDKQTVLGSKKIFIVKIAEELADAGLDAEAIRSLMGSAGRNYGLTLSHGFIHYCLMKQTKQRTELDDVCQLVNRLEKDGDAPWKGHMDRSFVQSILDLYKQVSQVEEANGKLLTEYTIDDANNIKSLDSAKAVAKCHIQRSEYYQQQATERDQDLIAVTKERVYKLRIVKEGISQYIPVKIIVNPKSSEPVVVILDDEDNNYEKASRLKIGLSLEEQKAEAIVASEGIQEIDHDATNIGLDMATNDNTMTFSNTNTSPITQQIYHHCIKCQAVLNSDNWYDGSRKASVYICKPCDKARHAAYRKLSLS